MSKSAPKSARFVENLEGRQLMAAGPRVASVTADNRGEVQLNLTEAVTNVTKKTVRMFLAGADDIVGTADDVNANAEVSYVSKRKRIVIKKDLPAGTGYRIRVDDAVVSSGTGQKLDGEFKGNKTSGNGEAGGSYSMQVKNDKGISPKVRMYSNLGAIDLVMFRDSTPLNVQNFLNYVDSGDNRWANSLVTRLSRNFVLQGGGVRINNSGNLETVTSFGNATGEPNTNSATKYRISLALSGGADSGSNQWFINLANNSFLDSQGFTSFGEAANAASQAVIDAMNGLNITQSYLPAPPAPSNFQPLDSLPLTTTIGLTGSTQNVNVSAEGGDQPRFVVSGGFSAPVHAIYFPKVAQLMRIYAI